MRGQRRSVKSVLAGYTTLFCVVAGLTYLASSLTGQVMVEQARRTGMRSIERAQQAERATRTLQAQVDALVSLSSVQTWAKENAYTASEWIPEPSKRADLVAYQDSRHPL